MAYNQQTSNGSCHWMRYMRLYYLVLMLLLVLITIPLIAHYYLSNIAAEDAGMDIHRSRSKLDHPDDLTNIKISDLKFRIEELKRIKASVNNELRDLEEKRQKLHTEISGYNTHLDRLKGDYEKSHVELQQLRATIENTKLEQEEMIQRNMPELTAPKRILPSLADGVTLAPPKSLSACRMHNCFDFSRCSVTSQFPVYLYDPGDFQIPGGQLEQFIKYSVTHALTTSPHMTYDPNIACVYIVLFGEVPGRVGNASLVERHLHSLPYWRGDGRNHILINMARTPANGDPFQGVDTGRAMTAQSLYLDAKFRDRFDILIPPSMGISHGDVWDQLPYISPARRKHLLSFQGEYRLLQGSILPRAQSPHLEPVPGTKGRHEANSNSQAVNKNGQNVNNNGQSVNHRQSVSNNRQVVNSNDQFLRNNGQSPTKLSQTVNNMQIHAKNVPSRGQLLNGARQTGDQQDAQGHNQPMRFKGQGHNQPIRLENQDHELRGQGHDVPVRQGEIHMDMEADVPNSRFGRTLKSETVPGQWTMTGTDATELVTLERTIVDTLKRMQSLYQEGVFHFEFTCPPLEGSTDGEWALCGSESVRRQFLQNSTFSLIIAPTNTTTASTVAMQVRLYEALKYGAIPVVLGDYVQLPYSELLQWERAVLLLPKARVTELHFFLQSMSDTDILRLRQQGRIFWETYFGTTKSIVDMILATLRTRLHIPPFPVRDEPAPSIFNASFVPLTEDIIDLPPEAEELLGPMEGPLPSQKFRRNFTVDLNLYNERWDPFHLYPFTPYDPILPAEAKFLGSGLGFRPIGKGAGGAGKEFHEALGGNQPREQFTIVMLTYEREAVLINALRRLKGLPHLNKVIVVWNSPLPPNEELKWPDIGVKIHVVKTAKNSLNNRFMPYDAIETEAILSIDDDAHLRQDEITFGFRVWREARDRIVGFPGRFHAWDLEHKSWLYNSNHSCELSMVLTGAAFFHKYYAYLYSHVMPQAIKDKVDEYMNCEDLAMNFLVSHITKKPPIKVTSRWTFRCPGCPQALSEDDSHFQERHKCINFFTRVYGYMPLLNTQFRVDSVLFKTRIPHDKQKCFKFI